MSERLQPRFLEPGDSVPEGMHFVRSHKRDAAINIPGPFEPMFGKSGLTVGEVLDLTTLQAQYQRENTVRQLMENLDDLSRPAQTVVSQLEKQYPETFRV